MKIDVIKEMDNKLLHRKELDIVVSDVESTPSKKDILSLVAAKMGASENAIVLGSIYQEYGKKEAKVYVKVYESEELKKTIEPKPKVKKETTEENKTEGEKK